MTIWGNFMTPWFLGIGLLTIFFIIPLTLFLIVGYLIEKDIQKK